MLEEVMSILTLDPAKTAVQQIQTAHRIQLINFWQIHKGARILEIGCGQGDTTAALAVAVGETGFVHAVDIASSDYGAPETLGEAKQHLMHSEVGHRIRIDFDFDVMNDSVNFAENQFDYIVLAHCLWYLAAPAELTAILKRVLPWGKQLCLAEWNPIITHASQFPHFQAVQIQAICEAYKTSTDSNVRTIFYPADIQHALTKSGWQLTTQATIDSPDLQDGQWEVNLTTDTYPAQIKQLHEMPKKLEKLLQSEISALKQAKIIRPMATIAMLATK